MSGFDVWVVFTKSFPMEGCSIDIDGTNFYFAEAYVPVETGSGVVSLDFIIDKAKEALLEDRLQLIDVPKCVRFREEEWPHDASINAEVHRMAQRAINSDEIGFGSFRPEEIEEFYECRLSITEISKSQSQ